MVATESQDVLNRRFISDFASVVGFFNTLLACNGAGRDQCPCDFIHVRLRSRG